MFERKLIRYLFLGFIILIQVNLSAQTLWYHDLQDSLQGTNIYKAKSWLKTHGYKPKGRPIVAIIDSGIDTTTRALQEALWKNPKERLDGVDNDKNGYVGDLHGWNFLGTRDGTFDMISAGREEFRQFKRLYPKYKNVQDSLQIPAKNRAEYSHYLRMKDKAGIDRYLRLYHYMQRKDQAFAYMDSVLRVDYSQMYDTITMKGFMQMPIEDSIFQREAEIIVSELLKAEALESWKSVMLRHQKNSQRIARRIASIEGEQDKRLLMGDHLSDATDIYYGNNHLMVEGYEHGNFVAGIIGANKQYDPKVEGVYPLAQLMILRAVPNGDEYDKDIATSIRYAVDNGAKVINMSLGKYASDTPQMLEDALSYAAKHDVLVLQAAGNDAYNLDSVDYYPRAKSGQGTMENYLRIGASNKEGGRLRSSNYSSTLVDLFAPGEAIYSYMSGNKSEASQGTSLATPITSGVAAMLRAYFPNLSAVEIKRLLVETSRPMQGQARYAVGGLLDAERACQTAARLSKMKKHKRR